MDMKKIINLILKKKKQNPGSSCILGCRLLDTNYDDVQEATHFLECWMYFRNDPVKVRESSAKYLHS